MATALDTLCGQAFGAGQHHLLGVYTQRAMLVIAVACAPISLVWANASRILACHGQDPAVAAEAGVYARWLVPSVYVRVSGACDRTWNGFSAPSRSSRSCGCSPL
ncbi:hypothetical protein PR202_ga04295 [Eleusine coracana subsp. coracana]|uniref:MATE efflux family protein n=1 Tax=Eleusine coracana subsp. coracana TaxID=191504 RepID=A0AAV5BRA0_ELECO|nr:hypothetical protein PR202_ga04295 [Eleusine coracana subsp. coracana]